MNLRTYRCLFRQSWAKASFDRAGRQALAASDINIGPQVQSWLIPLTRYRGNLLSRQPCEGFPICGELSVPASLAPRLA